MHLSTLHNEKELLALVAEGDKTAFTCLFEHYRNAVYSIALRFVPYDQLAEELVQDVFLKIWIKRAGLKDVERFDAYLFIIVRNQSYKAIKKLARYHHIISHSQEDNLFFEQDVQDEIQHKDLQAILQEAVGTLPPQQRQVYVLAKQEGLKRNEVASRLNLSAETVKVHLSLAMRTIRAYCLAKIELCILLVFLFSPE